MESGRGGMGSHKHGISGHARNNPLNMREVARDLNREADARARRKDRLASDGMADIAEVFGRKSRAIMRPRTPGSSRCDAGSST
jgi:hypothetical protein